MKHACDIVMTISDDGENFRYHIEYSIGDAYADTELGAEVRRWFRKINRMLKTERGMRKEVTE